VVGSRDITTVSEIKQYSAVIEDTEYYFIPQNSCIYSYCVLFLGFSDMGFGEMGGHPDSLRAVWCKAKNDATVKPLHLVSQRVKLSVPFIFRVV